MLAAGPRAANRHRVSLCQQAGSSNNHHPVGTEITVRLGETLSSKESSAGQGFSATVAQPVVVDGKTIIEKGAAARGTVVDAKGMGHFKGGALLEVRLNSVSIHGKETSVDTGMVARRSPERASDRLASSAAALAQAR